MTANALIRRSWVIGVVALGTVVCVGWMQVRAFDVADEGERLRGDAWRAAADYAAPRSESRTTDGFRRIGGCVFDESAVPVAGAEVLVVDLARATELGVPVSLDSCIPDAWIESTGTTNSCGLFEIGNLRLGPKALFARRADSGSISRRVCRLIDGVSVRGFDLRIAPRTRLRLRGAGIEVGDRLTCCPVFDEFYPERSVTVGLQGECFDLNVPDGARPRAAWLRDASTGAEKLAVISYSGDGTAWVAARRGFARVPATGVSDGRYRCVVDDLDFGVPCLFEIEVTISQQIAEVPMFSGRVGLAVRVAESTIRCVATLGAASGDVVVSEFARVDDDTLEVDLTGHLRGEILKAAEALPSADVPLRGCDQRRLSLVTRARRKSLSVLGASVLVDSATAVRFPIIQVETTTGRVWRGGLTAGGGGQPVVTNLREATGARVDVSLPWAYTWCRLECDDGTTLVARSGASGSLTMEGVPIGQPFLLLCDDGPFALNRYRVTGECVQGATVRDVEVSRMSEVHRDAPEGELYGFVHGRTKAQKVHVFCQPADNPRGVRTRVCDDSPFFSFVLDPGRGYLLVALPVDDVPDRRVQYLKRIVWVPGAVSGARRRVDLELGGGEIRVLGAREAPIEASLVWLGAVNNPESRVIWTWTQDGEMTLRNVPVGRYRIDVRDGALVAEEFQIDSSSAQEVHLRAP